jgi:hypothetical protein
LKGLGRRVSEETEEVESSEETDRPTRKGPVSNGRPQPPSSGKFKSAKDIPHGMSTLDVLMKD